MIDSLSRLFDDSEQLAADVVTLETTIRQEWNEYVASVGNKFALIESLANSDKGIAELKRLLKIQKTASESQISQVNNILRDLEIFKVGPGLRRVQHVVKTLGYASTGHQYVHDHLEHLHEVLLAQSVLVIQYEQTKESSIREMLRQQAIIEREIITHLEELPSFMSLFQRILRGERQIHRLTSIQQALSAELLQDSNSLGIPKEEIRNCMQELNEYLEDHFRNMEAAEVVQNHDFVDFQLISQPQFLSIVTSVVSRQLSSHASAEVAKLIWFAYRKYYAEMNSR